MLLKCDRDGRVKHYARGLTLAALAALLLVAIAALTVHSLDMAFWVDRIWPPKNQPEDRRETLHAAKYAYGVDEPISFGAVENPVNAYFRLKLRFRVDDTEGLPNLFQSAPANEGIRVEISGANAAIIMPERPSVAPGTRQMLLTTELVKGKWHVLELEAENGGFVFGSFDGRGIALYAGYDISIAMSQFIVGSGFDASRPFRGEIADISLDKGNLAGPPSRAMTLVYVIYTLLVIIFLVLLCLSLRSYPSVRRLTIRLSLLVLPLLLILGYFEYRLSYIRSSYFTKRIAFENQINDTEILVTGSSITVYGVDPSLFPRPGFNLAFLGQQMFYDARMIERYLNRMPSLRMVVLTVNYFTLGTVDAGFDRPWRPFFDRQYFSVPTDGGEGLSGALKFLLEPRNFSKIAIYGNTIKDQARQDYEAPVDFTASSLGWFGAGDVSTDLSMNFGLAAANAHNGATNEKNYDQNLGHWDAVIEELQRRRIAVAIVELPTDSSYHSALDQARAETMRRKVKEFAAKHRVRFVDYTGDQRFSSADFSWEYPDHMNDPGATKFSKILSQEVIQPELD
jgi:hypothetical protein